MSLIHRTILFVPIFCHLATISPSSLTAQCTGCTTTISGVDDGYYAATLGTKICLAPDAEFTGEIELLGGTFENCATAQQEFFLSMSAASAGSIVNNYGTIKCSNYWTFRYATYNNYGTVIVPTLLSTGSSSTFNNYGTITSGGISIQTGTTVNNFNHVNTTASTTINIGAALNNFGGAIFDGGKITVNNQFLNVGIVNLTDKLDIKGAGTVTNDGGCMDMANLTVTGDLVGIVCGTITVTGSSSVNSLSAQVWGDIAIVDLTPPGSAPFVDSNSGTIASSVTWTSCCCSGTAIKDLFISEYGEPDGGNGKYLEIYNPTSASVDLSSYEIWKVTNGGTWAEQTLALTGTINAHSTFVIGNNITDVPASSIVNSGIMSFNGDDPMGLAKNGSLIDAVGTDGPDPGAGFEVAGIAIATQNNTLVRKSSIIAGNIDWTASAGTNVSSSEWTVVAYSQDDLGMHVISCDPVDTDSDGIEDSSDNCVSESNADQADLDMDGIGDVCDDDTDGDTILNINDCAPLDAAIFEGASCDDGDANTINDLILADCTCMGTINTQDSDGDTILDVNDNCINTPNTDQADLDNDNIGDLCDNDIDGDGVDNASDCAPMDSTIFSGATCPDTDGDTIIDFIDIDDDNDGILDIDEMSGGSSSSNVIVDWHNEGLPYFLDGSPGVNETQNFIAEGGIEVDFTVDLSNIGSAPVTSTDWESNLYLGESLMNMFADFTDETESYSYGLVFNEDIEELNFMVRELDGMEAINVVGFLNGTMVSPVITTTTAEIAMISEGDGSITAYSVNQGAYSSSDPESQLQVNFESDINMLRITSKSNPLYVGNPSPRRSFEVLNIQSSGMSFIDTDSDGVYDHLDLDSDNDGIYDVIEAGGEDPDMNGIIGNGTSSSISDTDNDGWSNIVDPDDSGSPLTDPNTDGTAGVDRIDIDSDGDGCSDVIEAGFPDSDGDGQLGGAVPPTVNVSGIVTSGGL